MNNINFNLGEDRGETATTALETIEGIDISMELDGDTLRITSNLSEEDTKAIVPQIFPAWMFGK